MPALGRHLLAELWGCDDRIDDRDFVERAMRDAVAASGATLLHLQVHAFDPQGVTALAMLSESHLALHTWPEKGYAAADLFTCGDHVDGDAAVETLRTAFGPETIEIHEIERGVRRFVPSLSGGPSA